MGPTPLTYDPLKSSAANSPSQTSVALSASSAISLTTATQLDTQQFASRMNAPTTTASSSAAANFGLIANLKNLNANIQRIIAAKSFGPPMFGNVGPGNPTLTTPTGGSI